jgi:hypothetical protein
MTVEAVDAKGPDVICTWLAEHAPQHQPVQVAYLAEDRGGASQDERL